MNKYVFYKRVCIFVLVYLVLQALKYCSLSHDSYIVIIAIHACNFNRFLDEIMLVDFYYSFKAVTGRTSQRH